jgi:hypothetical protein
MLSAVRQAGRVELFGVALMLAGVWGATKLVDAIAWPDMRIIAADV